MLQVSVYRYNPETDKKPYMQDFEIDTKGKDVMVLDVLHLVKEKDNSMSYRRSCREGVCGSDGLNMNGKNGLACITPLSEVVKTTSWSFVLYLVCLLFVIWWLICRFSTSSMSALSRSLSMIHPHLLLSACNHRKSVSS